MIGNHFKKKFSKRPPPGIIVTTTQERTFENVEVHTEQQHQLKLSHLILKNMKF